MKNKLPRVTGYGQYSNDNYGVNALRVDLDTIDLYYSCQTIVAYSDNADGLVCCVNVWGVTTGKHLNWIEPDKTRRVERGKFESMLESALARHIQ